MGAASGRRVAEATSRHLSSARLATAAVLLLALAAACINGDDSDDATAKSSTKAAEKHPATTVPTTTEPLGARPADVEPYIQKLLGHYDKVVQKIAADPSVANDRSDPLIEEFTSLFDRGNDFVAGSLKKWSAQADDKIAYKPLGPGQPLSVTRIEGPPQAIDEDTVNFGQCTILNYVTYTKGAPTERVEQRRLAGNGTVVRVRGHWRLSGITTPPGMRGCIREGGPSL